MTRWKTLRFGWISLLAVCAATPVLLAQAAQAKSGDDLEASLKRLKSPFSGEVTTAARSIERLGPKAKAAVPDLNQALTHANFSDERIALARALGAMGPAAEEAAPNLALTLKRAGFPQERQALMKALGQIGPGARSAVPTLVEMMRSGLPEDARLAAQVLGEIGPAAREAVPALRQASLSGFTNLKTTATDSLRKVQANDVRFGVRDNAHLFSPIALQSTNQELQEMAARERFGVLVETYAVVPAEQAARVASRPNVEGIGYCEAWALEHMRTRRFQRLVHPGLP